MPKLLVLSPTPTHPTNAGNRARIKKWLEACVEEGIDFHFAFMRQESADETAMAQAWGKERCSFLNYEPPWRLRNTVRRWCSRITKVIKKPQLVPYHIDDWKCESLVADVRELANHIKPTCVQIEYAFFSHLFECFDKSVFKILDTHDILAKRGQMFLTQGREPEWFYTTERQEAIALNRADYIVAIQEQECSYFKSVTRKPVATVGHMVSLRSPRDPSTTRPTAVFMGSGNRVNQDALNFLCEKIWPIVRSSVSDAILEVYGGVCEGFAARPPGLHLMGTVAEVSAVYDRAWLIMCPLRFGTGLKIKSIEALGQGKALVTTASGCSGIEDGDGKAFLRSDLAEDFARHCIEVLVDQKVRNSLERGAYEYANNWNLRQQVNLRHVIAAAGLNCSA